MKAKNLKDYTFYAYETTIDEEGCKSDGYSSIAQTVQAYIYPAGGRIQAEMYGERLAYMLNMLVNNPVQIKERDGICVDSAAVNYRVVAVEQYSGHSQITLERV